LIGWTRGFLCADRKKALRENWTEIMSMRRPGNMSEADDETARILNLEIAREEKKKGRRDALMKFLLRYKELEQNIERYRVSLLHISSNDTVTNECCARAKENGHLLDHYIASAALALKSVPQPDVKK